jgi:hypothetical protein
MKWTLVDSHGREVVLRPPANGRDIYALEGLQERSRGILHAPTGPTDHHAPGACHQPEPLKPQLFPARHHGGHRNRPAGRGQLPKGAVFLFSEGS